MRIAVFCGSLAGNDPVFAEAAVRLGQRLAAGGHELIYGGSSTGLMTRVADEVLSGGGRVIGVLPAIELIQEIRHPGLSEYYDVPTMDDRKAKMIELADAFIALPGGPGTMEEYAEVVSLNRIGEIHKPCVLYDVKGFYQPVREYFENMIRADFIKREEIKDLLISESWPEIERFLHGA